MRLPEDFSNSGKQQKRNVNNLPEVIINEYLKNRNLNDPISQTSKAPPSGGAFIMCS